MGKILVLTSSFLLILAACLFGSAGTIFWPMAWVFLAVFLAIVIGAFVVVDPDLIRDRAAWRSGYKRWDPPLAGIGYLFLCPLVLVVAGLDVKRFGWSPAIPSAIQGSALLIFVLGYLFALWGMSVNQFFVKFVRIQEQRGHHVVKSGPYAYIRHPGYAGAILAHCALPVALGSLWALLPACFGGALFVLRTWLEDRTLQDELSGYRDYVDEVRWRLVPGVW